MPVVERRGSQRLQKVSATVAIDGFL